MGGSRLVGLDYVGPDVETEKVQEAARRRRKLIFSGWPMGLSRSRNTPRSGDCITSELEKPQPPDVASKHVSFDQTIPAESNCPTDAVSSPALTATAVDTADAFKADDDHSATPILPTVASQAAVRSPRTARWKTIYANLRPFLRNLFMPCSVTILLSFVIAIVPQLKALFVEVDGTHISPAPDGEPPLAFILDAASFIGAASVPMGLISLGSALARISVPRSAWGSLPSGAILSLAVAKMLISPVLGVLICKGLVNVNVISRDDKVLQFVCIFFSCLPTATTQVRGADYSQCSGIHHHPTGLCHPGVQWYRKRRAHICLLDSTVHSLVAIHDRSHSLHSPYTLLIFVVRSCRISLRVLYLLTATRMPRRAGRYTSVLSTT